MKKIQSRALLCIIICSCFGLGLIYFMIQYGLHSKDWTIENYYSAIGYDPNVNNINNNSSTHAIYISTNSNKEKYYTRGQIVDSKGNLLATVTEKEITFSEDEETRLAMLHTIGDREKNISTGAIRSLSNYFGRYVTKDGEYTAEDNGNTIKLTMDVDINKVALKGLGEYAGTVGVYNYKTGEILCMVSTPTYDPDNIPSDIQINPKYAGAYINRFFSSAFTPGSPMKTLSMETALETVPDILDMRFTCNGTYEINKQVVHCTGVHGVQDIREAYANSCNCAFSQISEIIRREDLEHAVNSGGLTTGYTIDNTIKTGVSSFDILEDNDFQYAWTCIGLHHDLINPCSLLVYLGACANGGKAAVPTMIKEVTDSKGNVIRGVETTETEQLMNPETAQYLKDSLVYNTTSPAHSGHYRSWMFNMRFGAKTGTITRAQGGWNGWLVGIVDDERWPYAYVVYVEKGGYGMTVAGVIAAQVLNALCK